jgi:hypothetical protein
MPAGSAFEEGVEWLASAGDFDVPALQGTLHSDGDLK